MSLRDSARCKSDNDIEEYCALVFVAIIENCVIMEQLTTIVICQPVFVRIMKSSQSSNPSPRKRQYSISVKVLVSVLAGRDDP